MDGLNWVDSLPEFWRFIEDHATQLSTLAALIGAFVGVVGMLVAVLTFFVTSGALLVAVNNLRQVRDDSDARTRPYISLRLVPGVQHHGSVDLIIENKGGSPAQNIRLDIFEATEPLEVTETFRAKEDRIRRVINHALENTYFLAPGARMRWMWHSSEIVTKEKYHPILHDDGSPQLKADGTLMGHDLEAYEEPIVYGMPQKVVILATYESVEGTFKNIMSYTNELTTLDSSIVSVMPSPAQGADNTSLDGTDKYLRNIENSLRTLNLHTGLNNY